MPQLLHDSSDAIGLQPFVSEHCCGYRERALEAVERRDQAIFHLQMGNRSWLDEESSRLKEIAFETARNRDCSKQCARQRYSCVHGRDAHPTVVGGDRKLDSEAV